MPNKRKSISKRVRFEVFKRDQFTCAYCGAHPPAAILQVDHITPVSGGGDNSIDNLITSCADCNVGKSNKPLSSVPDSLATRSSEAREREDQLLGYRAIMDAIRSREDDDILAIEDVFLADFGTRFTPRFSRSIRSQFLPHFTQRELCDFAEKACAKFNDPERAMQYFCGICWNIIKGKGRA